MDENVDVELNVKNANAKKSEQAAAIAGEPAEKKSENGTENATVDDDDMLIIRKKEESILAFPPRGLASIFDEDLDSDQKLQANPRDVVSVTRLDVQRLQPGLYLNDTIIDFWLK